MEAATHTTAVPPGLAAWCEERSVPLCVLFGSRATGRARVDSDWDVAIWASPPTPETRLRWLADLQEVFGETVQMIFVTPELDPVLGFQIVREGRLLFTDDPDRWPAQRARLWHLYNDSLPFRRAERDRLRAFAEEVRAGS